MLELNKIYHMDCLEGLKQLDDESIDCVVTSPPYWNLRDYKVEGQIGLEPTFEEYIEKLLKIFDEVKRVLKPTGTCWINLGDTYSSIHISGNPGKNSIIGNKTGKAQSIKQIKSINLPPKCLCLIPSRFAVEMINRGWILRNEIIWYKPNAMPESVKDRFTVDFEKIFFFVKNKKYYFEQQKEKAKPESAKRYKYEFMKGSKHKSGGYSPNEAKHTAGFKNFDGKRNKRSVWTINTKPFSESHFAVYPPELIEPCILAGCPEGGIVLDPFMGAGTTALVALKYNRNFIGFEINKEYINIAYKRLGTINKRYYDELPEEKRPAQMQLF